MFRHLARAEAAVPLTTGRHRVATLGGTCHIYVCVGVESIDMFVYARLSNQESRVRS